jgi:hypothetical protein
VPVREAEGTPGRRGRDLGLLVLLLALAGGLRAWGLTHTEVVARDSIVFIDYALQFEHKPWPKVLRDNHQHPGYPLSLWAVSVPVRHFLGATDCVTMQLSAQLASALAGVLLVIPMFFLGRELFDRGAGFWGALFFQCLPVSGRVLCDALSEPLFLLLFTSALLLAVRGLRSGSLGRFVACGLCCGLAYLTRPEGAEVVAAVSLVLLLVQAVPAWRRGWRWTLTRGLAVALTAVAVGSPYLLVTRHFTNKPSPRDVIDTAHRDGPAPDPSATRRPGGRSPAGPVHPGTATLPLAVWLNPDMDFAGRLWTGLGAVAAETAKDFHYLGWLPAVLGLWWYRRRLRQRPEAWLILILVVVHAVVLWRLAVVANYVSERHVLSLVLLGSFPAAAAVRDLPRRCLDWRSRSRGERGARGAGLAVRWSWVLLLGMTVAGLPKTMQRLHANRAGHHAAGLWLAAHARPTDEICDGHFGWASYYAGRLFLDVQGPPAGAGRVKYVVKGRSNAVRNPYGPTAAEANMTEAEIRQAGGRSVFAWPSRRHPQVVVWKVDPPLEPSPGKVQ